ncbi:hypothetical protein SCHPADRAFT_929728, partial [Schizopora paradoxa]
MGTWKARVRCRNTDEFRTSNHPEWQLNDNYRRTRFGRLGGSRVGAPDGNSDEVPRSWKDEQLPLGACPTSGLRVNDNDEVNLISPYAGLASSEVFLLKMENGDLHGTMAIHCCILLVRRTIVFSRDQTFRLKGPNVYGLGFERYIGKVRSWRWGGLKVSKRSIVRCVHHCKPSSCPAIHRASEMKLKLPTAAYGTRCMSPWWKENDEASERMSGAAGGFQSASISNRISDSASFSSSVSAFSFLGRETKDQKFSDLRRLYIRADLEDFEDEDGHDINALRQRKREAGVRWAAVALLISPFARWHLAQRRNDGDNGMCCLKIREGRM